MRTATGDEARILSSWSRNVAAWTTAVRQGQIESRRLVTDGAVIQAVLDRAPRTVLDIGCGEGWLVRTLLRHGIRAIGVDAIAGLLDQARAAGDGEFRMAAYDELADACADLHVDLAVCNFALFGRESVEALLRALPALLAEGADLVVQTLHPLMACGDAPYLDGWRESSWDGFSAEFADPAPWYFRTLESWVRLLGEHGFRLREVREPLHPATGRPASVIFIASHSR
ncbi:MAG: class I SAM-dependent methyltransferase [Nevskia sp.]|nr:class I SAM-dependent methyltransferase [Nevskia sp.]